MADSRVTDLTEESTPALDDELYLYDVTGTDDNKLLVRNVAKAHTGTSFPVAGLYDGMPFHRTDIGDGMACYYDETNTQWLTVSEYSDFVTRNADSATATRLLGGALRNDLDVYITRVAIKTYVDTTNNGSDYWTLNVWGTNDAEDTNTTILSFTTAADSPSTWTRHDSAATDATPANNGLFRLNYVKSGAGGDLSVRASVYYRYIIT
jgi:hypothetical protein